jgi:hypothetical protein
MRCVLYTVPARLIGRQLELHLHHDRIVSYLNHQLVVELPRIRVTDKRTTIMPGTGLEPVTRGFSVLCSTN